MGVMVIAGLSVDSAGFSRQRGVASPEVSRMAGHNADCFYIIPANLKGARLQGSGFPPTDPRPTMTSGGALTMRVHFAGNPAMAPAQLTGYFIFSAAPSAPPNQVYPSPFVDSAGHYQCFQQQTALKSTAPGTADYDFTPLNYSGGLVGEYELTFVAEAYTGTPNVVQWSADPEFETGN